jgi:hypothetical protein
MDISDDTLMTDADAVESYHLLACCCTGSFEP